MRSEAVARRESRRDGRRARPKTVPCTVVRKLGGRAAESSSIMAETGRRRAARALSQCSRARRRWLNRRSARRNLRAPSRLLAGPTPERGGGADGADLPGLRGDHAGAARRCGRRCAPLLAERFGNPSSVHRWGREARARWRSARARLAARDRGAPPAEVVFTRGGTEADNLAVLGRARLRAGRAGASAPPSSTGRCSPPRARRRRRAPRCSSCRWTRDGRGGARRARRSSLASAPAVVSVMWVNNEVGTVQPVARARGALRGGGRRLPHRRDAGARKAAGAGGRGCRWTCSR